MISHFQYRAIKIAEALNKLRDDAISLDNQAREAGEDINIDELFDITPEGGILNEAGKAAVQEYEDLQGPS